VVWCGLRERTGSDYMKLRPCASRTTRVCHSHN
jgi:hypothetical protein